MRALLRRLVGYGPDVTALIVATRALVRQHEEMVEQMGQARGDIAYLRTYRDAADRVFQSDCDRDALLPGFLRLGDCKAEGIVRLGEAYANLKDRHRREIEAHAEALHGRDLAYTERNRMVAVLSALWPASIEDDAGEQSSPDWPVVIIDSPAGQLSWHVHVREIHLFRHLPRRAGRKWDGHSTDEKNRRLHDLVRLSAQRVVECRGELTALDRIRLEEAPPFGVVEAHEFHPHDEIPEGPQG